MVPCSAVRKVVAVAALLACCTRPQEPARAPAARPSILLVTLDTTRADAIGPEQSAVPTPSFNALALRARRFRYAYTAVPQTLASHASMLSGLYPAGHGVHENGRYLSDKVPLATERLASAGYRTAAFVSAFAVARRFGLGRGFDVYDDDFGVAAERRASVTTDRALAYLAKASPAPLFLWVHYYDPHFPYDPPEPFRSRYASRPYYGEIASMDEQLGRLASAFEKRAGPKAIIVVADHGEGLGDHGEIQHGDLLYQSTVHVPLIVIGAGLTAGTDDEPVSTRRVGSTILDFAGIDATNSLRQHTGEIVLGEAMKPFLDYGWQPQVMAVTGRLKTILAGRVETFDVVADPNELHDIAAGASVPREMRAALRDYPIPSPDAVQAPSPANEEERRKLASLGYVSAGSKPLIRADAPRPADMARLFPVLDQAASLFVRGDYAGAIAPLQKILAADPNNLDAALRLATSYSELHRDAQALAAFDRAQTIAPESDDVRTYLALHYVRTKEWRRAAPLLERVVADTPDRLPALEALAIVREREGRIAEAVALRQKIYATRPPTAAELARLGEMAMAVGATSVAIGAFEKSPSGHELELGALYMSAGRLQESREMLDRVSPLSPGYPMALFKRAQVSVLLHEPDAASRIDAARRHADAATAPLIDRERLFR